MKGRRRWTGARAGAALGPGGLVAILLSGCGGDPGPGVDGMMVRDSAGVTIVEHPGELPAEPSWRAELEGALRLEGDFFQVRGAVGLPGGRVAVGNGGTRQILFFGPDGTLERAVGREGEGPGEFRNLTLLAPWPGDSVFAFDWQLRRGTVLDARGEPGRSFTLEATDQVPFGNVRGVHRDGRLLATGFIQTGGPPPDGRHRFPVPVYSFQSDGRVAGVLPVEASAESFYESVEGGFSVFTPLFGRSTEVLAGPDFLLEAANDGWELRIRESTGDLALILRRARVSPPVTPELRRAVVAEQLDAMSPGPGRDRTARALERMPVPERLPAFGTVAVSRTGEIWVAEYEPLGVDRVEWLVFSPVGEFAGRIPLPGRMVLLEIGRDHLVANWRDDFDVERVVVVELERPLVP